MVETHYRWDFIGLSTDTKPTPATSEKVVDGSTYYTSDNSKLYVWYKDQWYEKEDTGGGTTYTAGDNITISDGVISATDTTYSNFTGTDGTAAGAAGLVPAPATTDAGKFLKADGTWGEAGGGGSGVIELTSADYDWPENSPDGIQILNLPGGLYKWAAGVKTYTANSSTTGAGMILVGEPTQNVAVFMDLWPEQEGFIWYRYNRKTNQILDYANFCDIKDNLTSSSSSYSNCPLSAKQGYVLNQKITPTSASGAPSTSTVGELGKIYIDTATNDAYMCVNVSGSTYTWKQITA